MCSAAASAARSDSMSETTPRLTQPISGQLLLWDTKTVKQQVSTVVVILVLRCVVESCRFFDTVCLKVLHGVVRFIP